MSKRRAVILTVTTAVLISFGILAMLLSNRNSVEKIADKGQNEKQQYSTYNSVNNKNESNGKYIVEEAKEIEKLVSENNIVSWKAFKMPDIKMPDNLSICIPEINYSKKALTETENNSVSAGEIIKYTIEIENVTNKEILGMHVSDVISDKTILLHDSISDNGVLNETLNRINWEINIPSHSKKIVEFNVMVLEEVLGDIVNSAVVNGNKTNETINPIIKTTKNAKVIRDAMEIEKPVNIGDEIEYTINIINTGEEAAKVNIRDMVPEGTKLVSSIKINNEDLDLETLRGGKDVTIPANENTALNFTVEVESIEKQIRNVATVGMQKPEAILETAGISIEKTVSRTGKDDTFVDNIEAGCGDTVYFKIKVANIGTSDIEDLILSDMFNDSININITGAQTPIKIKSKESKEFVIEYVVTQSDVDNQHRMKNVVSARSNLIKQDVIDSAFISPVKAITNFEVKKDYSLNKSPNNNNLKFQNIAEVGDIINYIVKIRNTGNVTLRNLDVIDNDISNSIDVGVGETTTAIEFSYTVTNNDIKLNNGIVDCIYNKVTAKCGTGENYIEKSDEVSIPVRGEYEYRLEYYYDNIKDDSKTEILNANFGDIINEYTDKNITGYKLGKTEGLSLTVGANADENIIRVYYCKDSFNYVVRYYYDGKEDATKMENFTKPYGSIINTYTNKLIPGYKFSNVENLPLTISEDSRENIIKVYYIKDEFSYKVEYYYDNVCDLSKTFSGNATEYGMTVNTYPDKCPEGYKTDKTLNFPLSISENEIRNIISVYYVKDTFDYFIEYYYDNVKDNLKTESLSAIYNSSINSYPDKNITGYKIDKTEGLPLKIGIDPLNNIVKVYYVKDKFDYTVEYYYDGVKDGIKSDDLNGIYGTNINNYTDKNIIGYKLDKTEGLPLTIGTDPINNIIKVYYVKDSFNYSVEYYYDGIKDNELTEIHNADFLNIIGTYTDKVKSGYTFDSTENLPLTIGAIAANNIIKIYYLSNANISIEKTGPLNAHLGDNVEYTITLANTGGRADTQIVSDVLPEGLTYLSSTNGGVYNSVNRTITWSNITIPGIDAIEGIKTVTLHLNVKVNNDQLGQDITNTVTTNKGLSSNTTTSILEKTVAVNEMREGQQGKTANIILLMDLSSSMNETIAGETYAYQSEFVAPGDISKTRLYSAKQAASEFIRNIYAIPENTDSIVSIITFNRESAGIDNTLILTEPGDNLFATDGNRYAYSYQQINVGTQILKVDGLNYARSDNYNKLVTSINNLSIGCKRNNYSTYIKPAIATATNLIYGFKQYNTNENIVIVLSDGKPDDIANGNANANIAGLKSTGATIYSIGFGEDASNVNNTSYKILSKFSSDGTVLTAGNASTLVNQFKNILSDINSTTNLTTENGNLKITVSAPLVYPIKVQYNNNLLFQVNNASELATYELSYNSATKEIVWDMNEFLRNNHEILDLNEGLELTYYIPR